jgi:hypothetical protein
MNQSGCRKGGDVKKEIGEMKIQWANFQRENIKALVETFDSHLFTDLVSVWNCG